MSLALEICGITEAQVGPGGLLRVREVGVEVGLDSGVEPDSLEFCLETLLADAPFRAARPAIRVVQGDDLRVIYLEVEEEEGAEEGPVGETAPGAASGP